MAKKKSGTTPLGNILALLARGRWLIVGLVLLALFGFGWSRAWKQVREHVLASPDYRLQAKDIVVTPQPAWIKADIKAEVLRDASLEETLSVLDDELTVRIANAFSLHPWVARVARVGKHHPARVEVELEYRKPVAMIEVEGGLLPVDVGGVLLPSADFTSAEAKTYPRVTGVVSHPAGLVGSTWGDTHVSGAAKIAAAIEPYWLRFKLARIAVPPRGVRPLDTAHYYFELSTQAGSRVIWGRPPGEEAGGEIPVAQKLAVLVQLSGETGSLDRGTTPQIIDLRQDPRTSPRTAERK